MVLRRIAPSKSKVGEILPQGVFQKTIAIDVVMHYFICDVTAWAFALLLTTKLVYEKDVTTFNACGHGDVHVPCRDRVVGYFISRDE